MNEELFKARTRKIALGIIELVESLPKAERQMLSAGSYFGRARLSAQIIGQHVVENRKRMSSLRLAIVEEEADETIYWLELLIESKILDSTRVNLLVKETNEIVAMVVASIKTIRER